jgi:hypothetical protein
MERNKKILLGLALGWFVAIDILLSTSSASLSSLSTTTFGFRGVVGSLIFRQGPWLPAFSAAILLALAWLGIMLVAYVLRAWAKLITITRNLVKFLTAEKDSENDDKNISELIETLFGDDILKSRTALFWRFFQDLIIVWLFILIIQLLSGVISSMYSY